MRLTRQTLGRCSLAGLLVFLICAAFLLTGCASLDRVPRPAPSSAVTKDKATVDASLWKMGDPARRGFTPVQGTGSMRPVLDGNSILLLERATGFDLIAGDLGIYMRAGGVETTVHRAMRVNERGAVLFKGDNNAANDGWVSSDRVRWRVAGILYFKK